MLSLVSPTSARRSSTCAGGTPKRASTSAGSVAAVADAVEQCTRSSTSCIRSRSVDTIEIARPRVRAAHERRDHVVGLVARHLDDRQRERVDDLARERELQPRGPRAARRGPALYSR
jgi:hypothetical protein